MCKQQTDKAKYREEYSHLSGLQGLLELAESGHSIAQIVGIPTNRIDNKPIKYLPNSTYLNLPVCTNNYPQNIVEISLNY